MEENKRFRNHFSIVFERLGAGFVAFAMIFLYEGAELLGEIGSVLTDLGNLKEELIGILAIAVGIFVLFAIIFGIQIFRWSKTYISIQDQAIVIEVNTLKHKKNTIGIKNISNINLEQNLFEMLMGTCKVKMDTNSMSTADATDVKIVLRKKQAQEFQAKILGMITENTVAHGEEKDGLLTEVFVEDGDMSGAGLGEMLIHGFFSISVLTVLIALGSIMGAVGIVSEILRGEPFSGEIIPIVLSMVILGLSMFWRIAKGFVQYYDFKIQRMGDRIYISYGLLKKVSYTIPVDKINAVKLVQSPQARIMGMYMAELVNVGMGDDESEAQSFFLLYGKKLHIQEKIKALLPEFSDELETEVQLQSAKVWIVWALPAAIYILAMCVVLRVANELLKEGMLVCIAVIATITLFVLLYVVGNYFTRGVRVGEKSLKLVDGNFGRKVLLVKYSKIQYVQTKQSFLAKFFGIEKGEIYLLASTKNRIHNIPYFLEEEVEKIKQAMLY